MKTKVSFLFSVDCGVENLTRMEDRIKMKTISLPYEPKIGMSIFLPDFCDFFGMQVEEVEPIELEVIGIYMKPDSLELYLE